MAMMKGAIVKFAIPAVFEDMLQAKLVLESKDAVRMRFRGVEVVFRMFEWGELFSREVFWESFDREVGKIVGHSMGFWRLAQRVLIRVGMGAD